jgi:hypothetical protein
LLNLIRVLLQTQGLNIAYKAATEVEDASGVSINKDYVVSEIGTAGDSLQSLSEGYSMRSDQSLSRRLLLELPCAIHDGLTLLQPMTLGL